MCKAQASAALTNSTGRVAKFREVLKAGGGGSSRTLPFPPICAAAGAAAPPGSKPGGGPSLCRRCKAQLRRAQGSRVRMRGRGSGEPRAATHEVSTQPPSEAERGAAAAPLPPGAGIPAGNVTYAAWSARSACLLTASKVVSTVAVLGVLLGSLMWPGPPGRAQRKCGC